MNKSDFTREEIAAILGDRDVPGGSARISQKLLEHFSERHHLELTELVRFEEVAIRSTSIANILINDAYANLSDSDLSDPAIGLLLNLLHRNFEHVEAAIVLFVTGCGASSEVTARAALESSINLLYILTGDRWERLKSYFHHYLDSVDRQVKSWKVEVSDLPPEAAALHQQSADMRMRANLALRSLLLSITGDGEIEAWPRTIQQRFQKIGKAISYRTIYARMSAETHADAEETLRYFVGKLQGDAELFEAMALETVWMTRLHVYYATSWFLKASIAYAMSYNLSTLTARLKQELESVDGALAEISTHVGAGI